MPASRRMSPASDAATFENREWPCCKIVVLTSRCEHTSAMRARSRPDHRVQRASQAWAVSSAIGHALGKRRLSDIGAHELASRGLEHDLQLAQHCRIHPRCVGRDGSLNQTAGIAIGQFGATTWLVSPSNFVLHKPGRPNPSAKPSTVGEHHLNTSGRGSGINPLRFGISNRGSVFASSTIDLSMILASVRM
jgi:hypothetical protein